jgi:hypothetical protein
MTLGAADDSKPKPVSATADVSANPFQEMIFLMSLLTAQNFCFSFVFISDLISCHGYNATHFNDLPCRKCFIVNTSALLVFLTSISWKS